MCFIQRNNGDIVFDQEEIMEETEILREFIQSNGNCWCWFKKRERKKKKKKKKKKRKKERKKRVAPNAHMLTVEDREITEGQITYTEAYTAVRGMKNYKSPRSDGYTSELKKKSLETLNIFWFGLLTMDLKINKCQ